MRRSSGFTVIELLIVGAIVGVVAAIAIPNYLNAVDRGKQTRSMADMRSIGTACEAYAIENAFYPVQISEGSIAGIASVSLEPAFIKATPLKDAWSNDIQYSTAADGKGYTIRSLAKDGIKNGTVGPTHDFDCDIVFSQGRFTAYPRGVQT